VVTAHHTVEWQGKSGTNVHRSINFGRRGGCGCWCLLVAGLRHKRGGRDLQRIVPLQERRRGVECERGAGEGRGAGGGGYLISAQPCLRKLTGQATGQDAIPKVNWGCRAWQGEGDGGVRRHSIDSVEDDSTRSISLAPSHDVAPQAKD
jgi:hypothetical protein